MRVTSVTVNLAKSSMPTIKFIISALNVLDSQAPFTLFYFLSLPSFTMVLFVYLFRILYIATILLPQPSKSWYYMYFPARFSCIYYLVS